MIKRVCIWSPNSLEYRFGNPIGSFATSCCEPRQDRKVATVAASQCAEDVLVGLSFLANIIKLAVTIGKFFDD